MWTSFTGKLRISEARGKKSVRRNDGKTDVRSRINLHIRHSAFLI